MNETSPALSIVVPAYNEAAHLDSVITSMASTLEKSGIDYEIRVVNNGSRDGTGAAIKTLQKQNSRIRGLDLQQNQQYGGGVLAGLGVAKGAVVGWAHADGQTDPGDIVRLYQKMLADDNELGKSVRVASSESIVRKILSAVYYLIFQLLFWSPYRDMNGTPKLMTRAAMQRLSLESRDWFLDPEFVIKSLRYKMPITEIETIWHGRRSGGTKAHLFMAGLEFLKNMILYRIGVK